jgi:nucleoside-diphosphate-sugar epimerase
VGFVAPFSQSVRHWNLQETKQRSLQRERPRASGNPVWMLTMKRTLVVGGGGRLGRRVVRTLVEQQVPVLVAGRDPERAESAVRAYLREVGLERQGDLAFVAHDITEPAAVQAEQVFRQNDVDVVIDVAGPSRLTPLEPYTVDYKGNRELMRAASAGRGINHFILVTSLGTGRFGWPAALLNLAYGILFWKRRAELFLIDQVRRTAKRSPEGTESGGIRQFTIIRPAGLERATDNWGETHALQIRPADSIFGGTVSRLQVAQVAVLAALHPDASRNKIFELTTEQGVQQIDPIQQMESVSAQVLS